MYSSTRFLPLFDSAPQGPSLLGECAIQVREAIDKAGGHIPMRKPPLEYFSNCSSKGVIKQLQEHSHAAMHASDFLSMEMPIEAEDR
jgi:hypothetical protein